MEMKNAQLQEDLRLKEREANEKQIEAENKDIPEKKEESSEKEIKREDSQVSLVSHNRKTGRSNIEMEIKPADELEEKMSMNSEEVA